MDFLVTRAKYILIVWKVVTALISVLAVQYVWADMVNATRPGMSVYNTRYPKKMHAIVPDEMTAMNNHASRSRLALRFEANRGQADARVKFLVRGNTSTWFLTQEGPVIRLALPPILDHGFRVGASTGRSMESTVESQPKSVSTIVKMRFLGANPNSILVAGDPLTGVSNYFLGSNSQKWITGVLGYSSVLQKDIYPGIDLVYRSSGQVQALEYDLIVSPSADPTSIQFQVEGAQGVYLDETGSLVVDTKVGSMRMLPPKIYQVVDGVKQNVSGSFALLGDSRVGFELSHFHAAQSLVIDPVVLYASHLGGAGDDHGHAIAVDGSGQAYVVGQTLSTDFPTTVGPEPISLSGYVVFVTKINQMGSEIVYSTFLGGTDNTNITFDQLGIAVDEAGFVYITGKTLAPDYPTFNAFQGSIAGAHDAFVTKLGPSGGTIVYSTYLGGSRDDFPRGLALGSDGSVFLVGQTRSTDFPTVGALQDHNAGETNAFVAKLTPSGAALAYSTYLGGSDAGDPRFGDFGYDIAVNDTGEAFVTGLTNSADFPVVNAMQSEFGGGEHDAFVAKLNADGSELTYSSYLGGQGNEEGLGIAIDADGSAYITGWTTSDDFPNASAYQPTKAGGVDAFVIKLDESGSGPLFATYLGGSALDYCFDIAVNESGQAFVVGSTESGDFPTTASVQSYNAGGLDTFVTKLNADGSGLSYSTYIGGSGNENKDFSGFGIALDTSGDAYLTATTNSTDFPIERPFQALSGGGFDAYVAKISTEPVIRSRLAATEDQTRLTVEVSNGSTSPREVELKVWFKLPTNLHSIVAPPQILTLPPESEVILIDNSLPPKVSFPGATVGARLIDPVSGEILSESFCSRVPCN